MWLLCLTKTLQKEQKNTDHRFGTVLWKILPALSSTFVVRTTGLGKRQINILTLAWKKITCNLL